MTAILQHATRAPLLMGAPRPKPRHTAQSAPIDWSAQPRWAEWAIMDDHGRWWVFRREPELVPRDGRIERGDWFADDSYNQVTGKERHIARMANEPEFGIKRSERIQWMDSKRSRRIDRQFRRGRW